MQHTVKIFTFVPMRRAAPRRGEGLAPPAPCSLPLCLFGEYSSKPTYPLGKWFFYERVLEVPNYIIFEPDTGELEVYQLDAQRRYELRNGDADNRYWITQMSLFLGVWQGTRENRTGYWLRWWNQQGEILLWGAERAQQLSERTERLAAQLRAIGIAPEI